jgi:protocatechuate 3,4-dioxygenase beta subunit
VPLTRRDLLARCLDLGVVTAASSLLPLDLLAAAWQEKERRALTPPAALGPFYKKKAPTSNKLRAAGDPGLPLVVSGEVFSSRGDRLSAATVEVWQTDHLGFYDLEGYRYRAALTADAAGKYDFTSVMPGHYPDRVCQHIHYLVRAPEHKPLVTQLYFATDPVFEGDPAKNFQRDPLVTSYELVRPVQLAGDPKDIVAQVRFDVVLERL